MQPSTIPSTIPGLNPSSAGLGLPGCILYYDMNESGSILTDLSGNGYNGKVTGCVQVAGPVSGKVRRWAAGSSILCYPRTSSIAHTFEFWLAPSIGTVMYPLDVQTGRILLQITADATPAYYDTLGGVANYDDISLGDGVWTHVVWVCTTAANTMYFDSVAWPGSVAAGAVKIGGTSRIGWRYDMSANQFLGDMGIVRIYDRALSASEVLSLWNADHGKFGI